jgi:hypothetical protein
MPFRRGFFRFQKLGVLVVTSGLRSTPWSVCEPLKDLGFDPRDPTCPTTGADLYCGRELASPRPFVNAAV